MSKSINTQYDEGLMAKDYHFESKNTQEKDPGRSFLYTHIDSIDRSSLVLDMGCGSGIDLLEYRKMGFKNLIGVDPSEKILDEAKNLNKDIQFKIGTLENIPLVDDSVDVIMSRHALHYCKNVEKAFNEVCRVLKPNGIFMAVASNPRFDSSLKRNSEGNIVTTLFAGKITITFPQHSIEEYFGEAFIRDFDLLEEFEYNGPERDDYIEGMNNTLAFIARKKISPNPLP